jgi:hypothetical protein
MRIEVTEHNNIKYDNAVYVAGTVFEADEESAKALIESGAAVQVEESAPENAPEATYAEVKERAQALGLPVTGKKDELLTRVEAAVAEIATKDAADSSEGDKTPENAPEA